VLPEDPFGVFQRRILVWFQFGSRIYRACHFLSRNLSYLSNDDSALGLLWRWPYI
jgi:hypothetical protein